MRPLAPFVLVLMSLLPLVTSCGSLSSHPPGDWIDLSYDYSAETIYWPTAQPFQLNLGDNGMTDEGYWYEANTFSTAEHGGTHIDAPVHFAKGKRSVDQIPIEDLQGPAVVVDVSAQARADRD